MKQRSGERLVNRPSGAEACAQCIATDSNAFCPVSETQSFPLKCKHAISAGVAMLLPMGRPSTIRRLVVAVVVNAVYRVAGAWSRSHVTVERIEGLSPSLAHRYPAARVVGVLSIGLPVAPSQHCPPGTVLRGPGCVPGKTVGRISLNQILGPYVPCKASATFCGTGLQGSRSNDPRRSARAATLPKSVFSLPPSGVLLDSQTLKCLSGEVLESWSVPSSLADNHDVTLHERVGCGQSRQAFARLLGSLHCSRNAYSQKRLHYPVEVTT